MTHPALSKINVVSLTLDISFSALSLYIGHENNLIILARITYFNKEYTKIRLILIHKYLSCLWKIARALWSKVLTDLSHLQDC